MRVGFTLEYSLGHTTHAENLKRFLAGEPGIQPTYIDIPFHNSPGWWSKMPLVRSNWSIRASLAAYLALRPQVRELDAAFFHTQVTSLFSAGLMRRLPSVISLDATPIQYDRMGEFYGHTPGGSPRLEALKKWLNVRAFRAARHLVTWSQWTKESLITDYGITAEKITVIPPGIDTDRWSFPTRHRPPGNAIQLLFVGGDFHRKGGDTLLEAFQLLPPAVEAHLHLVTPSPNAREGIPGVTVHRNLKPNSEELLHVFQKADLFVFPTRADCLPIAVMEALAAGLPVITTAVGALSEAVTHGETGLIIPPGNVPALLDAITLLASDGAMRSRMSNHARQQAVKQFSSTISYGHLVDIVKAVAR